MQHKEHELHGILHSAKLVQEVLRGELAHLGIQPRQAQVLAAMKHMAPVSQGELAEIFHISPASMSTMTDRLIAAGFINRNPDARRRNKSVLELTDAGREKLDAIFVAWEAVDAVILSALGPKDAKELFRLSRLLRTHLGGRPPERRLDE